MAPVSRLAIRKSPARIAEAVVKSTIQHYAFLFLSHVFVDL